MRYSRKFIEARFARAMDAIGAPHGEAWAKQDDGRFKAKVGVHFIDYNPVYGGYVISKMVNEGGGESCPYGMNRHKAEAFIALLDGILGAAEYLKNGEERVRQAEADRRYEAMRRQDMEGY